MKYIVEVDCCLLQVEGQNEYQLVKLFGGLEQIVFGDQNCLCLFVGVDFCVDFLCGEIGFDLVVFGFG